MCNLFLWPWPGYTVSVMVVRVVAIILVMGLLCAYMSFRSMALSPLLARHPWHTWGVFALLLLTTFLIPILTRFSGKHVAPFAWVGFMLFGLITTYLVYLPVADLSQFLLRRFWDASASAGVWALRVAIAASVVSVIIGCVQALSPPKVRRVEVPIVGLHKEFEEFSIVQLSDLHINSTTSMASLEWLVDKVNELNPSLIAITGDFLDGPVKDLRPKVAVFEKLDPKHGIYFVTGNHEYYSGDLDNWLEVFSEMNWCVLTNSNVFIQRNEAKLAVLGIPDSTGAQWGYAGPDLAKAMEDIPKGTPKLLLHHRPAFFKEAEKAGIALLLAGHTHGGQYFPWTVIIPLFHHLQPGLKRYRQLWVYTNVGVGYWGPPNRFLNPKELTLLVLKKI